MLLYCNRNNNKQTKLALVYTRNARDFALDTALWAIMSCRAYVVCGLRELCVMRDKYKVAHCQIARAIITHTHTHTLAYTQPDRGNFRSENCVCFSRSAAAAQFELDFHGCRLDSAWVIWSSKCRECGWRITKMVQ